MAQDESIIGEITEQLIEVDFTSGLQGIQGEAATITIGTVTTLAAGSPATVANSGDPNDAVFDFGIPQGIKGDTGEYSPTLDVIDIGDGDLVGGVYTITNSHNGKILNFTTTGAFSIDIPLGLTTDKLANSKGFNFLVRIVNSQTSQANWASSTASVRNFEGHTLSAIAAGADSPAILTFFSSEIDVFDVTGNTIP